MSLARKAGVAGSLLFFRKMWGALVNIGVMAYLARTLDKSDFGLVAISGTLIAFIRVFAMAGISEYVVFYNGREQKEIQNAAFWLNSVLTLLITIIVLCFAPYWASLYKDHRIFNIICLLLIGFFFTMFSSIPVALYRKEMEYKPMIAIQTIFGTISQVSQVAFAFMGFGVYSLVLPNAVIAPLLALTLFYKSGYAIRWRDWGIRYWKKIFKYTRHVIGGQVLGKLVNEGDTLLIGKLLGMEALGIYDIAFKLSNIFNSQLLPIITNVSLPVFAKNQDNPGMVKEHFFKMFSLISSVFAPLIAVMILFAPSIIHLLYGVKWDGAILPFQILCVFAFFRSLSSPTSGLYNALGKPHIGFYLNLVFVPVFLAAIYISSFWGLVAATLTISVLRIIGSNLHFYLGGRLIGAAMSGFLIYMKPAILSALFSAIIIYLIFRNPPLPVILIFALFYLTFYYLFFRKQWSGMILMVKQLVPGGIK